ncbi:lytic transglycosylase domain-containing protein [Skermanella stibiiresistens]|uniref:lytic transglycosylase domain-containing protein n=1 Tax=Skermanella stibiiresistens TaxID=913326 RepID=UPI0004B46DD3|nr:lytic transglycosylase domain-containing protein [Skermanella stibiiresistens]
MVLLLAGFVSGCASSDQGDVSNSSFGAPVQVVSLTPAPAAPVDPKDPWRDLIAEASDRFDVPEQWIRVVMHRESGGRSMVNGKPITSPAGAIGLMQVMPATYAELRDRHGLGPSPTDPHDNIMAGAAYIREMYDQFGSPGFLAAYNCGPACYTAVQAGRQRLPRETRQYMAALAPVVGRTAPRGTGGEPAASTVMVASAESSRRVPAGKPAQPTRETIQVATAPSEPARVEVVRAAVPVAAPIVQPIAAQPIPQPAAEVGYDVASIEDEEYEVPRPAARPAYREAEARVVMRFTPMGGLDACGSLRGVSGACQPLDQGGRS